MSKTKDVMHDIIEAGQRQAEFDAESRNPIFVMEMYLQDIIDNQGEDAYDNIISQMMNCLEGYNVVLVPLVDKTTPNKFQLFSDKFIEPILLKKLQELVLKSYQKVLNRKLTLDDNYFSAFPTEVENIKSFGKNNDFFEDSKQAYKGNKAAIRRCRNKILELEKTCRAARKELTSVRVNLHLTK